MEAVSAHSREAHGSMALPGAPNVEAARRAAAENPGSFHARLLLGHALFQEERYEEAEVELRAALDLFPEYGGPDGPYLYLSRIHRERGELERAARALQQMGRLNETLPEVHAEEAEIWMELGEKAEAARALEKVVEIVPFQVQPHQQLASLYEELEDFAGAVRERRAILALDPTDRAEAHFRLALALMRSGDRGEARSQVLRALELAPSYEEALDLLLELRGGDGGEDDKRVKKMMKGWRR
jgi:tetratricopeptide (TPR) repeat protein